MMKDERALTIMELLVGISLFGVISLAFVAFSSSALRQMSLESRATSKVGELKNALSLLSSEVRMSKSISPYIVGTSSSNVTCSSAFSVSANIVRFLVVEDDSAAGLGGMQAYYVGYSYEASTQRLLRGEIAKATTLDCTLPAGDPTSSSYAQVLAEGVERIDSDNDGTLDDVFSLAGNVLSVRLGVVVDAQNGLKITHQLPIQVGIRVE